MCTFLCPKEANIGITYSKLRLETYVCFQSHLHASSTTKQVFVQLDGHWKNDFISTSCHIIACTNSIMFSQESQSTITAAGGSRLLPTCLWTLATHHQNKKTYQVSCVSCHWEISNTLLWTNTCAATSSLSLSLTCVFSHPAHVSPELRVVFFCFGKRTTCKHCRTEIVANGNQHLYDNTWQLQSVGVGCEIFLFGPFGNQKRRPAKL